MSDINEKEIKRRFEAVSKFEISPEVTERDLEKTRQTLIELTSLQQSSGQNIWSNIMKSNITKFAAAAVIIIALIVVLNQLGGSIDPASVAFAKATEALKQENWVHITEPDYEEWINYVFQNRTIIRKDGRISFYDYGQDKLYEYNPIDNSVLIYPIVGHVDEENTPMLWEDKLRLFEQKEPDGVVSSIQSRIEGKSVNIYTLSWFTDNDSRSQSEVIVDVETNLPVSALYKEINNNGTVLAENKGIFEYPQQGPLTIYETGVPAEANVSDYTSGELAGKFMESQRKMRLLGLSLAMYAEDNQQIYPNNLQELQGYYDDVQWCIENVEYFGAGQDRIGLVQPLPLAYDKTLLQENGQKTNIVFSDGHVEFCDLDVYIK